MPLVDCLLENLLGVRLDAAVEREENVLAVADRLGLLGLDDLARRIPDDCRLARPAGECRVELELETREACVVGADVAEHGRGDGSLRVDALLIGLEGEAGELLLRERGSLGRGCLPLDVDETDFAVGELPENRLL